MHSGTEVIMNNNNMILVPQPLTTISHSVDKKNRDHLVTKVVQSLEEPGGFRMDVTVWFRHKNEAMFYVDSVGHIHGPMDQHHTSRLGAMEQSATFLPGSKILKETETVTSAENSMAARRAELNESKSNYHLRHQSMSALDRSNHDLDRLLNELQHGSSQRVYQQRQQSSSVLRHRPIAASTSQFADTAVTSVRPVSTSNTRYTTRITRDHNQTVTPVTLKVVEQQRTQETVSSRERLLLDELLQARQELDQLKRSRSLMDHEIYGDRGTVETTGGWDRSNDSNIQTIRTERQQSSTVTSTTNPRQRFYSTDLNRNENDFRAATSLLPRRPQRTLSSSQMFDSHTTSRRMFQRPNHFFAGSTIERSGDAPISTYSAHQENLKQQRSSQQQQQTTHQQSSSEQRFTEYPTEVFEEIETITLQPIGKGVQDLDPPNFSSTLPRTPRATTPMGLKTPTPMSGFSTLPVNHSGVQRNRVINQQQHHYQTQQRFPQQQTNFATSSSYHRSTSAGGSGHGMGATSGTGNAFFDETSYNVGVQPGLSTHTRRQQHSSGYERQGSEQHHQQQFTPNSTLLTTSSSHHQHQQTSISPLTQVSPLPTVTPQQGRSDSVSSSVDGVVVNVTLKQVQDTATQWYLPYVSREETINLLKTQPPGSFIVRDSTSFRDAFGLAVKVPHLPPRVTLKSNDLQSELVRHYLIEPVANKGVRLKGFAQEPVFPTLAAFIHHHVMHAVALPVRLILPSTQLDLSSDQMGQVSTNTVVSPQPQRTSMMEHVNVVTTVDQSQPSTSVDMLYDMQQPQTNLQYQQGMNQSSSHQQQQQHHVIQTQTQQTEHHQQQFKETSNNNSSADQTQLTTLQQQDNSRMAPTPAAAVYETLYLGNYDVVCSDGQKALKTAVDHVLKQLHQSGRHTECQLEVSPIHGLTLSDNRRKLLVKRNFPKTQIVMCGLDPKNRTYNVDGHKGAFGKIFAFVVRKQAGPSSNGFTEGICYVFSEAYPSHPAMSIVKEIMNCLKSGDVPSPQQQGNNKA